jgi:hypothetical protein
LKDAHRLYPVVVGIIAWVDAVLGIVLLIDINYHICGRQGAFFWGIFGAVFVGIIPALIPALILGNMAKNRPALRSPRVWLIVTTIIVAGFGLAYAMEADDKTIYPLEAKKCDFPVI